MTNLTDVLRSGDSPLPFLLHHNRNKNTAKELPKGQEVKCATSQLCPRHTTKLFFLKSECQQWARIFPFTIKSTWTLDWGWQEKVCYQKKKTCCGHPTQFLLLDTPIWYIPPPKWHRNGGSRLFGGQLPRNMDPCPGTMFSCHFPAEELVPPQEASLWPGQGVPQRITNPFCYQYFSFPKEKRAWNTRVLCQHFHTINEDKETLIHKEFCSLKVHANPS